MDLHNIRVPHADKYGLSAVQTAGIDTDLGTREEPAHVQHFKTSLAIPLLPSFYGNEKMRRHIRKRRPGFDVVCVFNKPAGDCGLGRLVLQLPGHFRLHTESFCMFGIVWCPTRLDKVLHHGGLDVLH